LVAPAAETGRALRALESGMRQHRYEMKITLVVAAAENGVIGRGGRLPWRIPSDLKTFRRLTLGKPIIMGRKTYQAIGKPLGGRDNIVVTRDPAFRAQVTVATSLEAAVDKACALALAKGVDEIMVIGGAEIFCQALPLADRIYLTRVHAAPEGDAGFPSLAPSEWREVSREPLPRDARDEHACTLLILQRAAKN
jgi:dihydrofolate reductase